MTFTSETQQAEQAVWQWLDQRFSLTDVETEELQRLLQRFQDAANPRSHLNATVLRADITRLA